MTTSSQSAIMLSLVERISVNLSCRASGIYLISGGTRVWLKFGLRDGAAAMSPILSLDSPSHISLKREINCSKPLGVQNFLI